MLLDYLFSSYSLFLYVPSLIVFILFYVLCCSNRRGGLYRGSIIRNRSFKGRKYSVPTRAEQMKAVQSTEQFDVVIIGGGVTGTGIALDAVTRGLKVALFEADDFSRGTSSRTTKLAHGGVRYLQKAIRKRDISEFQFVYDALRERKHFIKVAPHLCTPFRIITPCFSWLDSLKNYLLLKIYDVLGFGASMGASHWISKTQTMNEMPLLKPQKLKGSVAYFDGQINDARMNLSIALTACALGGVALNHCAVTDLLKEDGKTVGVIVNDIIGKKKITVRGKCVINACGYMSDLIRLMDEPKAQKIIKPSSGVHVVLHSKYSPKGAGILIPYTSDGRVMFICNYENKTIVGTTEGPASLLADQGPIEENIQLILKNMNLIYEKEVKRSDIISSWSGVRPLVKDPNVKSTAGLSRDHYISVSKSNLLTICGGKYTTFRRMSMDCMKRALKLKLGGLKAPNKSKTDTTVLIGAETVVTKRKLLKEFMRRTNFDKDIAENLTHYYGDKAYAVSEIAKNENLSKRLHKDHPLIEAEVVYQVRNELAAQLVDCITTRLGIMYLDLNATFAMLERVSQLMAGELKWTETKRKEEVKNCTEIIKKCTK